MNCTKCGKELPKTIIINTNAYSLAMYQDWKENGNGMCIECYNEDKR